MNKITIGSLEIDPRRPGRRCITDDLGSTDVAINHYRLEPGDTFGGGYHTHHDQEEIFYVQSGVATFETDDGDITVGADEIIRFAPSEFQWGYNDGDETVVALGIGAPPHSRDVEVVQGCHECGAVFNYRRPSLLNDPDAPREVEVECPECGGGTRRIGRPD